MTRTSRPMPAGASRRAVLALAGAGAGAWLLVGCEDSAAPDAPPREAVDPDLALVQQARAAVLAAEQLTAAAIAAHPALSELLTPFREMHAAHLRVLAPAAEAGRGATPSPSPSTAPAPAVPRRRARAVQAVREQEQQYAATLSAGAREALSGPLARTLAAAAAGVAMHLAVVESAEGAA